VQHDQTGDGHRDGAEAQHRLAEHEQQRDGGSEQGGGQAAQPQRLRPLGRARGAALQRRDAHGGDRGRPRWQPRVLDDQVVRVGRRGRGQGLDVEGFGPRRGAHAGTLTADGRSPAQARP
jgi:hypothetical protein